MRDLAGIKENISVFDQANDIIFLHDARTGTIINLNEKAYQFYGYSLDEIRKQKKLDIYAGEHPYTEKEFLRLIKKAAEGEPQLFEWKTQNKAGEILWVEISLNRLDIQNRDTVLAVIRNLAATKPSELVMQQNIDQLTLIKDVSLAVINSSDPNEIMIAISNRAAKLLGTKHGFIYLLNDNNTRLELSTCTSSVSNFLNPEIKIGENLAGKVWQTGETGIVHNYTNWNERSVKVPADVQAMLCAPIKLHGKVIGIIGLCYMDENQPGNEEIAHLNYFAELASSVLKNIILNSSINTEINNKNVISLPVKNDDNWYHSIFDNIHDCIYLAEITDFNSPGSIMEANASVCKKLKYTREELLRLTPADIIPLECRSDIQSQMEKLFSQQQALFETSHMTKTGEVFPVEVNSLHLQLDGKPCILSIVRDISERQKANKEIALVERLNLVGSMAAGIGQEIRNPLTTVRGFLQMLINKEDCQDYFNHLDIMLQEIDRANSIITDFISLAKAKQIELRQCNLNTIIDILLPLLEAGAILYHKTIKTDLGVIPDIPLDDKDIRQLILNLVRNGLDSMPPRGTLTIKTLQKGNEVILAVQDQGKGIPPDITDKMGTPFFTTKEHGVGLGLAVCYSIAARHDATISFDTTPTGTTFHVHFKI